MVVAPAMALPGESTSPFCSSCFWLGVGLVVLCPCFLCPAKHGQGRGAVTARAQVKGCKKGPLLLYTDRSPRAWATYKRDALLGQAQNCAWAGGADFTAVTASSAVLPHDPR